MHCRGLFFGCAVLVVAGAPAATSGVLYSSVRKDLWLSQYPESGTKDPTDGRRIHIVAEGVMTQDSNLGSVTINGEECMNIYDVADLTYMDWCRVHANIATRQLWISLHSRNTNWREGHSLSIVAKDKQQSQMLSATVALTKPPGITLSYVTTQKGGSEAVLHLHSQGTQAIVSKLLYDGKEVSLPASVQTVPANGHVVVTVPGVSKKPGDVWTAVVFVGSAHVAFGGRVVPERFPIEAWPHSADCPVPGANDANAKEAQSFGIDSIYYSGDNFLKNCKKDVKDIIKALPGTGFHMMVDPKDLPTLDPAIRAQVVDASFVGDEVDGSVDADHLHPKLKSSLQAIVSAPEIPTYQGSKTHHNVGAFAGITDIQGSDAYSAACAPTMLAVTRTLPLQYPYYYLKNARDNHAPLPFWGYSQLYSDVWNYQANSNELTTQIAQAVLSGSKSIMFFQSSHKNYGEHDTQTWSSVLRSFKSIGEEIRVGDIQGVQFQCSSKLNLEVMAETILTPAKLVVVVVNTDASGYSNLLCHVGVSKHWSFKKHTIKSFSLDLTSAPGIQAVSNWQEVVNGKVVAVSGVAITGTSGNVSMSNIALDDKETVRIFTADVKTKTVAESFV